jgi:hypothetical protein
MKPNVTMSSGIVTSIRRDPSGKALSYQLDFAINQGGTGGPLVTEEGFLVGIGFSKLKNVELGFATPLERSAQVIADSINTVNVRELESSKNDRSFLVRLHGMDSSKKTANYHVLTFRMQSMSNKRRVDGRWVEASDEWHAYPMGFNMDFAFANVPIPKTASDMYFQIRSEAKDGTLAYFEPQELATTYGKGRNQLDEWQSIKLPSAFSRVVLAGGGRFLVFHLSQAKKLAVFDTSTREIVKEINLPGDGICTAGAEKIVFAHKTKKNLLRWDLKTFELDLTVPLDFPYFPTAIALGHSSKGPLLLGGGDGNTPAARFFDLENLKAIDLANETQIPIDRKSVVRVSGNGNLFSRFNASERTGNWLLLETNPDSTERLIRQIPVPRLNDIGDLQFLLPSQDGTRVFAKSAILSQDGIVLKRSNWNTKDPRELPSVQGDYSMALGTHGNDRFSSTTVQTISIYHVGSEKSMLSRIVAPFADSLSLDATTSDNIDFDQRVHFMPEDKVMVVLPKSNSEILIRRFDIDIELADSRLHYLFVTSQAPKRATLGEAFEYSIVAKSRREIVSYKVLSGQEGMSASDDGRINWTPMPVDIGDQLVSVSITDDWGKTILHSFHVKVEEPPK